MKISYYCQHVLGIGHIQRSIEICKAMSKRGDVTLIIGGPEVAIDTGELSVVKLPGLAMDTEFQNLQPCDPTCTLGEVKNRRKKQLFDHFRPALVLSLCHGNRFLAFYNQHQIEDLLVELTVKPNLI